MTKITLNSAKGVQIVVDIAWDGISCFEKEIFVFLWKIKNKGRLSW